jgi:sugar/nucleoside kinase (ribokinase family)
MGASFAAPSTHPAMLDLVDRARKAGCLVITDALFPSGTDPAVVEAVVRASSVILLNELELRSLTGIADVEAAIASLRARTSAAIVTKRGARGARIDTTTASHDRPAPVVNAIDSTGAGDAFGAALIAARLRDRSWESALGAAVRAGAVAVQSLGSVPRLPRFDELESDA